MSDKLYILENGKKQEAKGEKLEYLKNWQADIEKEKSLFEAEQTKKEADRASAMAKLFKLGLTDDEIATLIP